MKQIVLSCVVLLFQINSFSQNCHCDSLFLETQKLVEENYAGWFDKVTVANQGNYQSWTNQYYLQSKNIEKDSACSGVLQNWIRFFKDKHLRVKYSNPMQVATVNANSKGVTILKSDKTAVQIDQYFKTTQHLDPIEGYYSNESYQLAIWRVKPQQFYATIISSQNENWKPGEVKLTISKQKDTYQGVFYEGDKSDYSSHPVQLVKNILDFDIVFFKKTFPASKEELDITEYELSKDSYAPKLSFQNNIAVWKFPSFENNSLEQTAYLLEKYKDKLQATPYWVLDLRDNTGGDYRVGMQLMEYIYTNPILKYNAEMRMTPKNYDQWYKTFMASYYKSLDSVGRATQDMRLNNMKANYGKMFNASGRLFDSIKLNKLSLNPTKIALLINRNTVSSAELFTMLARQSRKVIVMGENSGGMMDYGNVLQFRTATPSIRLQLPINRSLWLDSGFSVDQEGLKPQIYLNGNDLIMQASAIIKKN